jgi:putative salt-induced outer membrane protein
MSRISSAFFLLLFVCAPPAAAQVTLPPAGAAPPPPAPAQPPPPPPGWAASLGAGLAVTSGNSDTSTVNLAYDLLRDYGTKVVFKSTGLYLRGENEGEINVDRAAANVRMEYVLTPRLSAFGQTGYFRDRFKDVEYLVSPTGGLTYKLLPGPRVELTTDGSLGMVFEKNTGRDVETDGAVLAGEKFLYKLSEGARITQGFSGLWKMDDFDDSLYIFSAGIAATLVRNAELKVELLNTYKNRPTDPTLDKNDVSFLVSFVYKID